MPKELRNWKLCKGCSLCEPTLCDSTCQAAIILEKRVDAKDRELVKLKHIIKTIRAERVGSARLAEEKTKKIVRLEDFISDALGIAFVTGALDIVDVNDEHECIDRIKSYKEKAEYWDEISGQFFTHGYKQTSTPDGIIHEYEERMMEESVENTKLKEIINQIKELLDQKGDCGCRGIESRGTRSCLSEARALEDGFHHPGDFDCTLKTKAERIKCYFYEEDTNWLRKKIKDVIKNVK